MDGFDEFMTGITEDDMRKRVFAKIANVVSTGKVDYLSMSEMKTTLASVDILADLKIDQLTNEEVKILKLLHNRVKDGSYHQPVIEKAFVLDSFDPLFVPLSDLASGFVDLQDKDGSTVITMQTAIEELVKKGWLNIQKGFLCGFRNEAMLTQASHV